MATSTPHLDFPPTSPDLLASQANDPQDIVGQAMTLIYRPTPLWKRAMDIAGSLIISMMLLPVFVGIAVYIRCVSKGQAIFKQSRLGCMGKYFTIYKFRTLHPRDTQTSDNQHREYVCSLTNGDKALEKPDVSEQMIPGGNFLRTASLDELPQLFNVLLGNMSLVGPRPDVLEWEDYPEWQRKRFEVTPGMTGLWQVSGKNRLTYAEMVELDLYYIEHRSLWLDLKILWKTIKIVLFRDND